MTYAEVVFSLTSYEFSASLKNVSVVLGTPAWAHSVFRYVEGFVMPPVYGFFTAMGPFAKLLYVSSRFGLLCGVEYGIVA